VWAGRTATADTRSLDWHAQKDSEHELAPLAPSAVITDRLQESARKRKALVHNTSTLDRNDRADRTTSRARPGYRSHHSRAIPSKCRSLALV
jgi:hypothetical protein